jgi:hypothetical protein
MMPVSVFVGAAVYRAGYTGAGIGLFVAGSGFYLLHLVSDWRDPRLGSQPAAKSEPITAINGLPLPSHLIALVEAGRWKRPKDLSRVHRLFPAEPGVRLEVSLYALDYMPFENKHWLDQTYPSFLGVPDLDRPPGDIDPKRSVLIGDLGPGTDQPIALDYRASMDNPRVLTLDYSSGHETRWIEIAPEIQTFAELMGL